MPRYALTVEYDGTPYAGWQVQPDRPTVQGAIERALVTITGETPSVNGAGRTDTGVHAAGQVAHIDLSRDFPNGTGRLRDALNAHLRPEPIAILSVERVPDTFDARFSATGRAYRYTILNRRAPPALLANRVWHVMKPLDAGVMNEAAKRLLGRHDFTTFRNADCQAKSPIKTLDRLEAWREGEFVVVEAEARSFLHNQIRSIVGCLKRVGEGAWRAERVTQVLEARDRKLCAALAPPSGLCFLRVEYGSKPQHAVGEGGDRDGEDEFGEHDGEGLDGA
jgi:tRNA pseudouridine38-40 synthase